MQVFSIQSAFTQPVLLLGAPRVLTIFNLFVAAEMVLVFKAWWIVLFCILIQSLGIWAAKQDPRFIEIFVRHMKHEDYYEV